MTTLSIQNIRDELTNLLRSSDILTTAVRGVTTKSDTFTATAGQTVFTLTSAGIKNVRTLTVQAVSKSYLRDYTISFSAGTVTLGTGATLNDTVVITYDYSSSGDKIYPDMPRDEISLTSYPRVGIELVNISTRPLSLGGADNISDLLISVVSWVSVNKDSAVAGGFGGMTDINTLMYNIRNVLRTNAKTLYTIPYITPSTTSPIIKSHNNKIMQQSQDYNLKFKVE